MLVIIDAEPKDHNIGLPTEAYIAVEEVHDVSVVILCASWAESPDTIVLVR